MTKQSTPKKQFSIQKIYCKDSSFETANSPSIFSEPWQPDINLDLNINVEPIAESIFEVCLTVTISVKCAEKTAYLVEIAQAGIFTLEGFSEQERKPMLNSFCPATLFPYAREAVSDLVTKGGFPQLLLTPINFDAIYDQHIQQNTVASNATIN